MTFVAIGALSDSQSPCCPDAANLVSAHDFKVPEIMLFEEQFNMAAVAVV